VDEAPRVDTVIVKVTWRARWKHRKLGHIEYPGWVLKIDLYIADSWMVMLVARPEVDPI